MSSQAIEMKLLSVQELSNYLKIKPQTIFSYISYKQLPDDYNLYVKIGRRVLFNFENVNKWLLAGAPIKKRSS